ncbi:MAG: ribosome small subunit-dependent GTPase A [Erysipelotrichaceae bacterium]|nr:ribosome small subunit-dependent GTPase A [Erysipelotrichaceae bacterium]
MIGRVIKIVSNQYTVLYEGKRYEAVAMGKLRLKQSPVVGDFVVLEELEGKMCIQRIEPRKNQMIRPSIANVDQAMIIMSMVDPVFSCQLVDRLLILIQHAGIQPFLVITKVDVCEMSEQMLCWIEDYRHSGYQVILHKKGEENNELKELLRGKITVLTGQSGAGKSSLINTYQPDFEIKTQSISKALGRGKHTTRHTELHEVCGGWVADTPGFSSLDFDRLSVQDLKDAIKEFEKADSCRFRDCVHENEPGCGVKKAVEDGTISSIRYQHYLEVLHLIQNRKEKY